MTPRRAEPLTQSLLEDTVLHDWFQPVQTALDKVRHSDRLFRPLPMTSFILLGGLRQLLSISTLREQVQTLFHWQSMSRYHVLPGRMPWPALPVETHSVKPFTSSPLLRSVSYTLSTTTYILGTTLFDRKAYAIDDLSDAYHSRWGIEELYKISKQLMRIEDFHGQSERGVKQELYVHFVLMTLTRIFSNYSELGLNSPCTADETPHTKANFKNALMTVARHIEGLLLQQAHFLSHTLTLIVASMRCCRQNLRPHRSEGLRGNNERLPTY